MLMINVEFMIYMMWVLLGICLCWEFM